MNALQLKNTVIHYLINEKGYIAIIGVAASGFMLAMALCEIWKNFIAPLF